MMRYFDDVTTQTLVDSTRAANRWTQEELEAKAAGAFQWDRFKKYILEEAVKDIAALRARKRLGRFN
jgi:hypothetical protein